EVRRRPAYRPPHTEHASTRRTVEACRKLSARRGENRAHSFPTLRVSRQEIVSRALGSASSRDFKRSSSVFALSSGSSSQALCSKTSSEPRPGPTPPVGPTSPPPAVPDCPPPPAPTPPPVGAAAASRRNAF